MKFELTHFDETCPTCGRMILGDFIMRRSIFRYGRRVVYEDGHAEIQVSDDKEHWLTYERWKGR